MNALRSFLSLVIFVGLGSACTKKDDATPVTLKPDEKIEVTVGKPIKGVMLCGAPMIFPVVPPVDATATLEVRIPKGAAKTCFQLNGRDASFNTEMTSKIVVCSDDPEKFSSMAASFTKAVTQLTIEPAGLQGCVLADFRLTLSKKK